MGLFDHGLAGSSELPTALHHTCIQIGAAAGGIAGSLGQLGHALEQDGAAAGAGGGDLVGKRAAGDHLGRAGEESGAGQVVGGIIGKGHVVPVEFHQLVGDALIRLLLPQQLGPVLGQLGDLLLIAVHQPLDHGFRVQTTGETGDDIGVAAAVNAIGGAAPHKTVDGWHRCFTPLMIFE